MNKNIWKIVLAIAIVFCFAAMPISGMIVRNGIVGIVKGDEESSGEVRNVAPTKYVNMAKSEDIVYNSGSDSITFTAQVIDRNREDDIGADGATVSNSWWNISRVGGNYTNKSVIMSSTPSLSEAETGGEVNLWNETANDGILAISDDDGFAGYAWTCPDTWTIGTYWSNLTITDSDGNRLDFNAVSFEVKSAVKIVRIYNYTGLSVAADSPFYWNFTTTDPGVLNVTSGNYSYTYEPESPTTNYGCSNVTARLWSYWIVINNTGENVGQCFNISFADEFISVLKPGTKIPTKDAIMFEYYKTSDRTYAENDTACSGSAPKDFSGTTYYVKDADTDGEYMFEFDAEKQNIWIRFMIDIPMPCKASDDYKCAYSMTA